MALTHNRSAILATSLISLSLLSGGKAYAFTTIETINYTWTGNETVQGDTRLFRDGTASVAGVQKTFPGTFANDPTYFYLYSFAAVPGTNISVTQTGSNQVVSFTSLYDGSISFNPTSLATGYLGDGGAAGPNVNYSILAPSSGQVRFVGSSASGTGAIGGLLHSQLSYTPVPAPLPILGAAAAFGYSRKLRKRIKDSKLPVASAID